MTLDVGGLTDALASHVQSLGVAGTFTGHEPKSAPGQGVSAATWFESIGPVRSSGLNSTSGRVEFTVRLYSPMVAEPQDAIDPELLAATSAVIAALSSDFTLTAAVRHVDLLGSDGNPLSAVSGYINQDGQLYRVVDITVPLIVNDIWSQS